MQNNEYADPRRLKDWNEMDWAVWKEENSKVVLRMLEIWVTEAMREHQRHFGYEGMTEEEAICLLRKKFRKKYRN